MRSLMHAVGGPSSFQGTPNPSHPLEGALAGHAPEGYYRCIGSWGIPIHLLLCYLNGPSTSTRTGSRFWPSSEDPREKVPHEENDIKLLKTQRPPHEAFLVRNEDQVPTPGGITRLWEDKTRKEACHPCCPNKEATTPAAPA
jgi:hypothetical protein